MGAQQSVNTPPPTPFASQNGRMTDQVLVYQGIFVGKTNGIRGSSPRPQPLIRLRFLHLGVDETPPQVDIGESSSDVLVGGEFPRLKSVNTLKSVLIWAI